MAGIHTYKHGTTDVAIYGIDYSVGLGGVNRMDDVQLIQVLINRYIDWRVDAHKTETSVDSRVLDRSGQQIGHLKVDGKCGPRTLAAIVATQKALNTWRSSAIDGRFDAFKDGLHSEHRARSTSDVRFRSMYILAAATGATPVSASSGYTAPGLPPFDVFALPEPLKGSLFRAGLKSLVKRAR